MFGLRITWKISPSFIRALNSMVTSYFLFSITISSFNRYDSNCLLAARLFCFKCIISSYMEVIWLTLNIFESKINSRFERGFEIIGKRLRVYNRDNEQQREMYTELEMTAGAKYLKILFLRIIQSLLHTSVQWTISFFQEINLVSGANFMEDTKIEFLPAFREWYDRKYLKQCKIIWTKMILEVLKGEQSLIRIVFILKFR